MPFEDSLIFFPDADRGTGAALTGRPFPAGPWVTAAEDKWLKAADGTKIHAWFMQPLPRPEAPVPLPEPRLAVLYFHGNAGNIAQRHDILLRFASMGFAVLAPDYRGYGRSEGRPSEKGIYQDARAAWDLLTGELGYSPRQVILFGKSLGGGPALELASTVRPGGLFVQSTFTSIPDMAGEVLPFVPKFLVSTKMNNLEKIAKVTCPVLVIHSRRDEIVPYRMGEKLFAAAPDPKKMLTLEREFHNDTVFAPGTGYDEAVREFAELVRQRAGMAAD